MQPDGQSDTPSVEMSTSQTGVKAGTASLYTQPVGQELEVVSTAARNAAAAGESAYLESVSQNASFVSRTLNVASARSNRSSAAVAHLKI